jgi:signal transduction histidine kinase
VTNKKTGNKHWEANAFKEKALVFSFDSIKNTDSSLFYNRAALKLFREIESTDFVVTSMLDIAENLYELNQTDSALKMIVEARLVKDSLNLNDALKISMLMSKIYESNKQWKDAQLETKKQINLRELLRDQEKSEMIESLKIKYDIRSKDIENQGLRRENSINDKLLRKHFWLSLSLALLATLMVILIVLLLKKRKADRIMNQKLAELNTKLLQKSEELRRSNVSKDKLFSIIAHDLRSPFQNLLGLSEILHEEMQGDYRQEYTSLINNSAQKAFHLLDDLLIWGRNQIESQNASIREIDLEPLLSEVIIEQEPQWRNKMLEIKTGFTGQMRCLADANIIKTVVRNIINNAIKFSPKGSEILIEAQKTVQYCSLNIRDYGMGMTEDQLMKLRKKEPLMSTEGTEKEAGNGLGLSLCFDLIEKINGDIRIESKKGKGSTFSIVIPLPS